MPPTLSVIVPTLGRETLIATVKSLIEAAGSENVEIVVVGKIGDPDIEAELVKLVSLFPGLKHLPASFESGDSSNKKNEGFEQSGADIVAFVDDDVKVAGDWLLEIVAAFDDSVVGMVSGPSLVPDELPLMARLAGATLASKAAGYVAGRYGGAGGIRRIKWSGIIGCNMAFRREALEKAGRFNTAFWPGEEMLAAFRVAKLGYQIVFQPAASLHHYPRSSFKGFVRQIYGYGATRIRLIRAGTSLEPTTLIPAGLIIGLLVLGVGSFLSRWCAYALGLGSVLYALADLIVAIIKSLETKKASNLLVFFLIPIMHLSYGVAEWVEVFRPGKDLSVASRRDHGPRTTDHQDTEDR